MTKEREPLLLLHGALGHKHQLEALAPYLEEKFELHFLNFEGHGEADPSEGPFRIEYFTENILGYLDEHGIAATNIFGYSMGGYVALALAKQFPELVHRLATLGTVLLWDEEIADRECRYLDPQKIEEKVPHFADQLDERHPSGWKTVVNKTHEMLQHLGRHPELSIDDFKDLSCPLHLAIGDRDKTAGLSATVSVYRQMDNAELNVLPTTPHPIEEVNIELLAASLESFFVK